MEPPVIVHQIGNLCSSLSGFFPLIIVASVVFESLATIFIVYKPLPSKSNGQFETKYDEATKMDLITDKIKTYKDVTDVTIGTGDIPVEDAVVCGEKEGANGENADNVKEPTKDLYGISLLKLLDFHLVIWPTLILGSVQISYIYNLSAMIKSFGLERFSTILLTVYFLGYALSRIPVFIFIDKVPNKSIVLLVGGFSITLAITICICFGNNVVLFAISIILSTITNSCTWNAGLALLSELFGSKYFGYNYGWLLFGFGGFTLCMQTLTGYLYDLNIDTSVTRTCYGRQCFLITLIICLCLALLAMLCSAVHLWKRRSSWQKSIRS